MNCRMSFYIFCPMALFTLFQNLCFFYAVLVCAIMICYWIDWLTVCALFTFFEDVYFLFFPHFSLLEVIFSFFFCRVSSEVHCFEIKEIFFCVLRKMYLIAYFHSPAVQVLDKWQKIKKKITNTKILWMHCLRLIPKCLNVSFVFIVWITVAMEIIFVMMCDNHIITHSNIFQYQINMHMNEND